MPKAIIGLSSTYSVLTERIHAFQVLAVAGMIPSIQTLLRLYLYEILSSRK